MLRRNRYPRSLFWLVGFCTLANPAPAFGWQQKFREALKNGGALVEDAQGRVLFEHRSHEAFIPASILKIATSACALDVLGRELRFATDLFLTNDKKLVVKGYGDPFLTSEELALMAEGLKTKGVDRISGIWLDPSHFAADIAIDGTASSTNPYDAINGALLANFNTVHFLKQQNGRILTAESQTPLTPTAAKLATKYPPGIHRVNLGKDLARGTQYTGELLTAFLTQAGIAVDGPIAIHSLPQGTRLIHRYLSSKKLTEVIRALLEFSTNFMANQLLLVMGAKERGAPATLEKGMAVFRQCLQQKIGWRQFQVFEGAGLSRQNAVTPEQMIRLLRHFEPYRDLLPVERKLFQAKTGTLNGVNTLAGYFRKNDGELVRFVMMVNDSVPFDYKFRLAELLYAGVNGGHTE